VSRFCGYWQFAVKWLGVMRPIGTAYCGWLAAPFSPACYRTPAGIDPTALGSTRARPYARLVAPGNSNFRADITSRPRMRELLDTGIKFRETPPKHLSGYETAANGAMIARQLWVVGAGLRAGILTAASPGAFDCDAGSGGVIGDDQRVTSSEALKAITINAGYQYFEEDSKGSIEVGKSTL
jgi:hypothetical protein